MASLKIWTYGTSQRPTNYGCRNGGIGIRQLMKLRKFLLLTKESCYTQMKNNRS